MRSAACATAAEPALDSFIEWSRGLRWDALPGATRSMVKRELLDYLGAAVAGRAVAGMPAWLTALTSTGVRPDASVIGGHRAPAHLAALCNGYFGHVLEYDDTHDEAVLHAGAATIPAALAAAQLRGKLDGRAFCEAVLAGVELTCRLGVATRLNLVEGGWIYTALFGHFGAALAAARILDHRPPVLRDALGIAYCLACGNHQSTRESAPTKHVQPGFAAANAVLATLMASAGLEGVRQPLTGEDGLSRVYLRGQLDGPRVCAGLGERFEIDRLSFKPYPTCRLTHPAISAALRLRAELGEDLGRVERVELLIGPQAHDVVGRASPERLVPATRVAAQFSAQWAVAAALVHGEVTPRQLLEEVPPSDRVRACIARIECNADTQAAGRDVGGCTLRAHGPFGLHQVREKHARGHPDNPLTDAELLAKFNANMRIAGVPDTQAAELARAVLEIDDAADVVPLVTRLASAASEAEPISKMRNKH